MGLILVTVPLLTVCVSMEKRNVIIRKDRIIIREAKIMTEDEKRLTNILKEYDKSLYKIQTFKNGKRAKSRGTLSEDTIGKARIAEIFKNAETNRLTGWTVQVAGVECDHGPSNVNRPPTGQATPTPTPTPPSSDPNAPSSSNVNRLPNCSTVVELVRRVGPILEKYNSK